MKKKGILGGTFDPIHNGHLHIAYEALYNLELDEIIFMPSGSPPHKAVEQITDSDIRYKLVKKAVEAEERFEVSRYEIEKEDTSYTYKTLQEFNGSQPNTEWYFITGVDCLMEIDSWVNVREILNNCSLVVFNRAGFSKKTVLKQKEKIETKFGKRIYFLDIPLLDISSTVIRKKVKQGENINYLVSEKVVEEIEKFNLYK